MSDLVVEMQIVFGLPPRFWACLEARYLQRRWVVNTFILQQTLEHVKHERVAEGESLCDFIRRHYGEEAVALVERGIKGEAVDA